MNTYLGSQEATVKWLLHLAGECELQFPQKRGSINYRFVSVDATNGDLDLFSYRPTIVPPVKRIFPDNEVLFHFNKLADGRYEFFRPDGSPRQILAGVRACDIKAIAAMDRAFGDSPHDPNYLDRRSNTAIVGFNCLEPCSERCFCAATESLDYTSGADVWVTPNEKGDMLLESLTEQGAELLNKGGFTLLEDGAKQRQTAEAKRPKPFGRELHATTAELPALLQRTYQSEVYAEYAEDCFSCGTCNLVCPTCYCFDVNDDLNLDTVSGNRTRTWDSCMNPGFAEVAGGHNFRSSTPERQRHRIRRKFDYLTERFGMGSFCVGCGRCGSQCTTGIDIFDMVNDLVAEDRGQV